MLKSVYFVTAMGCLLAVAALAWNPIPETVLSPAAATFKGAASCKKCHAEPHKTWSASKHSVAWDVLAEKYRDPAQVDDSGRSCVACHSTGFGQGGFVDMASTPDLVSVQCEACHGAGSLHIEAGMELVMARRKQFNEGEQTFITRTPTNCAGCHNPHVSHEQYKDG